MRICITCPYVLFLVIYKCAKYIFIDPNTYNRLESVGCIIQNMGREGEIGTWPSQAINGFLSISKS